LTRAQETHREPGKIASSENGRKRRSWLARIFPLVLVAILLGCLAIFAFTEIWPAVGAQIADHTRKIIGPQAVAQIEDVVFRVQDTINRWQYQSGVKRAEAPWQGATVESGAVESEPVPSSQVASREAALPPQTARPTPATTVADRNVATTPAAAGQPGEPQDTLTSATASPSSTPTPYVWRLPALAPFGSLEGEGVWQPYIVDREGHVLAERTFLQPDPQRPYTIVAVVAIDLTRTSLHFVLGFNEPALPDGPRGDGLIPETDLAEGVLLAAFNGGFRAANGLYGAMADGIVALPPVDDMATVGIYRSGEVRIGSWGKEISDSPDLEAWRQNCRLVIQDGEISPSVYNDSIVDWGASISNQIVTRRSGMGLDREAKTLYYFAGPSLSMPALANAMQAAGVYAGMLLDINNFWVLFTAIDFKEGKPFAEPLLPKLMFDHVDRYLGPSPADFFYVTSRGSERP
jgi:hypothetical protein